MRIMRLTTKLLSKVQPMVINSSDKTKFYYNIKHGSVGENMHSYTFGLDATKFKPLSTSDTVDLKDDNYVLLPIYRAGKVAKDKADNDMYFISTDESEDHKNDYIILWEIPNKFYTNVEYKTTGDVNTLGLGKIGRKRGAVEYISPAPILEVYGVTTLEWTATKDDINYKQIIKFDGEKWIIGQVSIVNKEEDYGKQSC